MPFPLPHEALIDFDVLINPLASEQAGHANPAFKKLLQAWAASPF
jgi:hypothetical protein